MTAQPKRLFDPREPRLVLQLRTGVGQAGKAFDAEIMNISTGGMLVKTSSDIAHDDPIQVVLPKSGAVGATVIWSTEDLYGCSFDNPISEEELESVREAARFSSPFRHAYGVDHETLGARIKHLRIASGYTMVELAQKVGVSKPTLWKWEGDQVRPRHETMGILAKELGIGELELVYGAPRLGEAAASLEEDDTQHGSLADIVRASRKRIAEAAGVDEVSVDIHINWGNE